MIKTTVYLEPDLASSLRRIAQAEGKSEEELIREALERFTRESARPEPSGMGKFHSGRSDISEKSEELLREASTRRKAAGRDAAGGNDESDR